MGRACGKREIYTQYEYARIIDAFITRLCQLREDGTGEVFCILARHARAHRVRMKGSVSM